MWAKILEIIERRWREKPKRDLVRNLLELRDAMAMCQWKFDRYYGNIVGERSSGEESSLDLYNEWIFSISRLAIAVVDIDRVLSIFTPTARKHIEIYLYDEMNEVQIGAIFGVAAMALGGTAWDFHRFHDPRLKPPLIELDKFIRENFKPEEIQAASNSRRTPELDPMYKFPLISDR